MNEQQEDYPLSVWELEAECIYTRACFGRQYTMKHAVEDAKGLEARSPQGAAYLRWLLERRQKLASARVFGAWASY